MVEYYPEGWLIDTAENRAALQSTAALIEACRTGQILEGRALVTVHTICSSIWGARRELSRAMRGPLGFVKVLYATSPSFPV